MQIVKTIKWDRAELHIFRNLQRWLSLSERARLNEDEYKDAARLANEPSGATAEKLEKSLIAWKKMLYVMQQQKLDAEVLMKDAPEDGGGLIAKPKQATIMMAENADMAITDITKACNIGLMALNFIKGELPELIDSYEENGSFLHIFTERTEDA